MKIYLGIAGVALGTGIAIGVGIFAMCMMIWS